MFPPLYVGVLLSDCCKEVLRRGCCDEGVE